MDTPGLLLLAAVGVLALVALTAVVVMLASARAERRRLVQELQGSRAAVEELRGQVERLSGDPDGPTEGRAHAVAGGTPTGFVITSLRDGSSDPADPHAARGDLAVVPMSGRDFATVALTESAVRVVSLVHGVRRALSAENRNRIRFEVRREVRRSRRQRRRDLKEARRHLRTQGPAAGRDAA
jgi:hypothetical protein